MKKIVCFFCLLLSLLMLISSFASCTDGYEISRPGEGSSNSKNVSGNENVENELSSDLPPSISDDVSHDDDISGGADGDDESRAEVSDDQNPGTESGDGFPLEEMYWNTKINILTHSQCEHTAYELGTYELTGERVNDAFYERTALIEERYGLSVDVTRTDSGYVSEQIERQMLSGDDTFDLVAAGLAHFSDPELSGALQDFNTIENGYIDLSADYWDQTAQKDLSIANRLYYITGDAVVSDDAETRVIYYNKQLVNRLGLEDPAELVFSGDWTVDRFYEMCRASARQSGTGDHMSFDPLVGDRWGMVAMTYDVLDFMWGAGQPMVTKDSNDLPVLRIDEEDNVDAWNHIGEMFLDRSCMGLGDMYVIQGNEIIERQNEIFRNGNALFMPAPVSRAESVLNDSGVQYGFIPMPKLNAEQDRYYSSASIYFADFLAIPVTTRGEKLDAVCYLLEAMAYWGREMCTDVYFDEALLLKYSDDENKYRMVDLIFGNRSFDLGVVYDIPGPYVDLDRLYQSRIGGLQVEGMISSYHANLKKYQATIDKIVKAYRE